MVYFNIETLQKTESETGTKPDILQAQIPNI